MKTVPVTNTTKANLHLAGKVIAPGDTRHIDITMVPDHLLPKERSEEVTEAPADPIVELLSGTVPEVGKALPDLDDEQLNAVEANEKVGQQRKGVLEAITAERLRRATPSA